jgi:hypothetical protein
MAVTPLGTVSEVNVAQPKNTRFPRLVTLLGISIETNEEQVSKALIPMLVILLRMLTVAKA